MLAKRLTSTIFTLQWVTKSNENENVTKYYVNNKTQLKCHILATRLSVDECNQYRSND